MSKNAANDFDANEDQAEQPAPVPTSAPRSFLDRLTEVVGMNPNPTSQPAPPVAPAASSQDVAEMDAIDEAVNPRLTKEVIAAVAAITTISPRTFSAIGAWTCFTPTLLYQHPELREKLADLQSAYEAAMKTAMDHVPRKADEAYFAYTAQCEKTTIETGEVGHATGKTHEDFTREFAHKFKLAIQASKSFSPRATELVRPHLRDYADAVRSLADRKATEEQRSYLFLGMPWKVSPLVATLYRAAEIVLEHNGLGHDPKSCAKFIDLDFFETFKGEHLTFSKPEAD